MRIIESWQYRFIEKSLYDYEKISRSGKQTDILMSFAIELAFDFFEDTDHEIIMKEFYFKADEYRETMGKVEHLNYVCENILYLHNTQGHTFRQEIINKIAMNCYALGVFSLVGRDGGYN